MQNEKELEDQFQSDVNEITITLVNGFGLRHKSEIEHLSNPLLRWLDFTSRYIPPAKRVFIRSKGFQITQNPEIAASLNHLEQLSLAGADLNHYQSKGLIFYNDTSRETRRLRTDLLFADWGLHHLHLSNAPIPSGKYFSKRSDWLLFCLVTADAVGLIDVRHHDDPELFSDPRLIREVENSWPDFMAQFRIKGVLPSRTELIAEEIRKLREGGITTLVIIEDRVYHGPGMGITTASTPTRVTVCMDRIRALVRHLATSVHNPSNQFKMEAFEAGCTDPEFALAISPNGLIVHEKKQNKGYFSTRTLTDGKSALAELQDLVLPKWALEYSLRETQAT